MHFTKRYRYRFGDIDDAGIAYYPSFFHYFHCAFEDWWSDALQARYSEVMHDEKFGLPVVHVESDFRVPVRYGDEPDIHLGITRLGNASVRFGYWMTKGEDPTALCRAEITTAGIHRDSLKTQVIPDKWRTAFAPYILTAGEFPD